MNRLLVRFFILFPLSLYGCCPDTVVPDCAVVRTAEDLNTTGRSFMFPHPAGYDNAQYSSLWHSLIYHESDRCYNGFQCIGFLQQSFHTKQNNRYFLINNKNVLLVAGDNICPNSNERDIRAEWIGLPSNFSGCMSLDIFQRQAGWILSSYSDLSNYFDFPLLNDTWLAVRLPFVFIRNDAYVCQFNIKNAPPVSQPVHDLVTAFDQPSWCFDRIVGSMKRFRPGDLRFDWGKTFLAEDSFEIGTYSTFTVPIGNKQNPERLFDPFTGANGHVGLGGGVFFQIPLNHNTNDGSWCFFWNLEGVFFFKNHQHRTYDLIGKPWSRFMNYVFEKSLPGHTIPGVNMLTFKSLVRPYCFADCTVGWRFISSVCEGEIGLDIWGRPSERLRILDFPERRFSIAGIGALNPDADPACQVAASAHCSKINFLAPNDPTFIPVRESDIDIHSAEADKTVTYKFHSSWGITPSIGCAETMCGVGFFIEFPHRFAALSRWGVWAKVGAVF